MVPQKNWLNHNFKTLLLSKRRCPAQEQWTVFGGIKDCYRWERLLAFMWAAAKHAGRHHTVQGAAGYKRRKCWCKALLCSCPSCLYMAWFQLRMLCLVHKWLQALCLAERLHKRRKLTSFLRASGMEVMHPLGRSHGNESGRHHKKAHPRLKRPIQATYANVHKGVWRCCAPQIVGE